MIESLPARRDWRLIYVGRSRSTMAFVTELERRYPGRVLTHASDENTVDVDLRAIVGGTTAEVYCCGPESLMSAVADLVPSERMHYERFIAIARTPELPPAPLAVTCSRSNKSFTLAPDENLLTELEKNGVPVMGSCRKGLCGTCEVRVLDGTPQHLDSVMDDAEKDRLNVMYPCVSRASGPSLVLDV
jgi:ferredoxin